MLVPEGTGLHCSKIGSLLLLAAVEWRLVKLLASLGVPKAWGGIGIS